MLKRRQFDSFYRLWPEIAAEAGDRQDKLLYDLAVSGALQAAGTALPVALHAGYQLAFGLAAVAALVATALGLVLRPTAMPAEGAAAAH